MIVDVTEFVRPNGKQVASTTEIRNSAAMGYSTMLKLGGRLTAERIGPNVSLCIEKIGVGDLISRIVKEGPKVQLMLAEMLETFNPYELESMTA